MAVQNEYIEAFNTCIDRLHQGDDLTTILTDYPDMAPQLRPMLEAGQAIHRIAYAPADVQQAQQRVEPAVQKAINGGGSSSGIWWIISVIVPVAIGAGLWLAGVSPVDNQASREATATVSPALVPAATVQMTVAPAVDTSDTLMILEGPVTSITDERITVYDTAIDIPANDARFAALQPGDVLRVEFEQTQNRLLVVDFQLRNATLIISDSGDVWRDDSCSNPPPAWVSDGAAQWQQRCLPSDTHNRGRGGSAASSS
jgi:hypothetical protein